MRFILRRSMADRRIGQRVYWLATVGMKTDPRHATRLGYNRMFWNSISNLFSVSHSNVINYTRLLLEKYLSDDAKACAMFVRQRVFVAALTNIAKRVQVCLFLRSLKYYRIGFVAF
jgi:hypothetical protein